MHDGKGRVIDLSYSGKQGNAQKYGESDDRV